MKNHGVIFRKIREQKSLTIESFSKLIGRSTGWISGIENNSPCSKIDGREFQRILKVCDIPNNPRLFGIWVANSKKKPTQAINSDGATLKHLRQKKNLSLSTVAHRTGLSISYLSKIENGKKSINLELRNRLLKEYGYSASSFKNFATADKRGKSVPASYRIKVLLEHLSENQREEVLEFAKKIAFTQMSKTC